LISDLLEAEQRVRTQEQEWVAIATNAAAQFDQEKAALLRLKREYEKVEAQRSTELQQLLARARQTQLPAYLRSIFIERHDIPDIGPGRKKKLSDNGIRTALDVEEYRIRRIKGFGQGRVFTKNLLDWRSEIESRFRTAIPSNEQLALDSKYDSMRQPIQRQFEVGERALRKTSQEAEKHLGQIYEQIKAGTMVLGHAKANLAVIPKEV
jgi:DNA-binding helix-hairpin-helix protein with protein kinase domain